MFIAVIQAVQILFSDSDAEGWGMLLVFVLIGFAIGFLIVDLLLKKFIRNWKKVMLVEIGFVLLFIGWYQYQNRPLILELPENFNQNYVTIIYEVDNANELGINAFTLRKFNSKTLSRS